MSGPAFDLETVIDAMMPMLGLDPAGFDRAAVAEDLRIVSRMAALVLDPPVGDHAEPAAMFVPAGVPARSPEP